MDGRGTKEDCDLSLKVEDLRPHIFAQKDSQKKKCLCSGGRGWVLPVSVRVPEAAGLPAGVPAAGLLRPLPLTRSGTRGGTPYWDSF